MRTGTVIAVTGDVGAGKSTVSRLFEELGGILIDADGIVAELWRTPDMIQAAVERWGTDILDKSGRVVHSRIAERIFASAAANAAASSASRVEYDWTTALLHPRVRREVERRIDLVNGDEDWVVVEIPLLFEAGVPTWVTHTVFVTADREVRLQRCRDRGWDEAELTRRESFFMDSKKRMSLSSCVIRNNGTLEDLKRTVRDLYDRCN